MLTLGYNDKSTTSNSNQSEEWNLILVNRDNSIPSNYEVELMELSNGEKTDERIYPTLQEMFDDARSEGVYPIVVSGYRTAKEQEKLLEDKNISI